MCKVEFKPFNSLQRVCTPKCAANYASELKQKAIRRENKVKLNSLKSKSEHLKDAQIVFNAFIRERDRGLPCIACGKALTETNTHASHFYSVGAYPNLRFHPDNCHGGCDECNTHLHGNIAEYSLNLPNRIGIDRYNELGNQRRQPLQLSIPEIIELKVVYKLKIKALCAEND